MLHDARIPELPEFLTKLDIPDRPAGFMSDNPAEIEAHVRYDDTGHLLRPAREGSRATLTTWQLFRSPGISAILLNLESGPEFEVHRRPGEDCYVVHIPLSGRCEVQSPDRFTSGPGHAFAFNPLQFVSKRWFGACWQIMVYIDRTLLRSYIIDQLALDPATTLLFDPGAVDAHRTDSLLKMVLSCCHLLAANPSIGNPGILRSLEYAIVCSLLVSLPHNHSPHLDRGEYSAAPAYLERTLRYIHENYGAATSVNDLAQVSGVGSRLLHYAFRRWLRTTPMAYVRHVRFAMARKMLRDGSPSTVSVTEISMAVGYRSLSRFSHEYRERFGETPSTTLRKGRLADVKGRDVGDDRDRRLARSGPRAPNSLPSVVRP